MAIKCLRCGGAKPQMCAPCVEQIADTLSARILELQRMVARMQNDVTGLSVLAVDSASGSDDKDAG